MRASKRRPEEVIRTEDEQVNAERAHGKRFTFQLFRNGKLRAVANKFDNVLYPKEEEKIKVKLHGMTRDPLKSALRKSKPAKPKRNITVATVHRVNEQRMNRERH